MDVEDYGFNRQFLQKNPEVQKVVWEAISNGWTSQRFEAALENTNWYKQRTEAQRQFDVLSAQDPKEKDRRWAANKATIGDLAKQMGVGFTSEQLERISWQATRNGLSQEEIQDLIAARWNPNRPTQYGQAAISMDALRQQANAYGIKLSDGTLNSYTRQILSGGATPETFVDAMREQAKGLYKNVATQLDNGATIADLMNPYMEMAAGALGLSVTEMDMTDPKWTKALSSRERSGEAMDMDEWQRTIRTEEQFGWDESVDARKTAAQFGSNLARMFGKGA